MNELCDLSVGKHPFPYIFFLNYAIKDGIISLTLDTLFLEIYIIYRYIFSHSFLSSRFSYSNSDFHFATQYFAYKNC